MRIGFSNNGKPRLSIIGDISEWGKNNVEEIKLALENAKSKDITIYVNSYGGDVFVANEIANMILAFDGNIEFELGAVCASAATYIVAEVASQKTNVSIKQHRNGQFMIHNVRAIFDGEVKQVESQLVLMKNLQENIVTAYVQLTGLTEDVIVEMMNNETWLSAQEALEKGFIHGIINDNASMPENVSRMTEYYNRIPSLITNQLVNKISKEMTEEQLALLGLPSDASDEQITKAIKGLKEGKEKLEEDAKTAKAEKIKTIVENAIESKKIRESDSEKWIKLLNADYNTAIEALANIKAVNKISDFTNKHDGAVDVKDWDYYIKKDPDFLNKIQKSNWELFSQLYEAKYGSKPE